jgi:hypothetical protein
MVKCQLLEEETKRMTMKPNVDTDTVTAFSDRNDQRSNWKRTEDGSPFPYNCYNC